MHRTLMAGMSLVALLAVAGCARDGSTTTSTAGSGSSGASGQTVGGTGIRGATDLGVSGDPAYRSGSSVQPQNRRTAGNRPGAGMPIEPDNRPPGLSPGPLSGDAGKRTTGEPGGT